MTNTQQLLAQKFPQLLFKNDFVLAPMTYFKIGGRAEVFCEVSDADQLAQLIQFCDQQTVPVTMMGGASNVIVADEGIPGITICFTGQKYQILDQKTDDGRTIIQAEVGWKTAPFVRKTIDDGFAGLEYFLGVPGRISGAVYNNAHYLQQLIGEHIWRVEIIEPNGTRRWLTNAECQFAYDDSIFHRQAWVIIQVEFALQTGDVTTSMDKVKHATLYRAQTQPLGEPSSGCFFRNPPNTDQLRQRYPQYAERAECPAAFLIDQLGLKGTRIGGVEVSSKHAAFLINVGGGTSKDALELKELVKKRVLEEYGVELKEEVFFLGPKTAQSDFTQSA